MTTAMARRRRDANLDRLILRARIMGLGSQAALEYLEEAGYTMDRRTLYRHQRRLDEDSLSRLHKIARSMRELHLDHVEEIRTIHEEMWSQYSKANAAGEPRDAAAILDMIMKSMPIRSAYEEATQAVMEDAARRLQEERPLEAGVCIPAS